MERIGRLAAGPGATRATVAVGVVSCVVAAALAPERQDRRHLDHVAFEAAIGFIRRGDGIYQGFIDGMQVIDARVDQVRAVREPWILALWAGLPKGWLLPAYFVVVVLGSTLVAVQMVRWKPTALLVGAWAAIAGVYGGVDAWLLYELWAVPLILGACLAHLRGHHWVAAACCVGACALRETAVLLPIGFLLGSIVERRHSRPYVTALAVSAGLLLWHYHLAEPFLDPDGASARLAGTGSPQAVAYMTSFLVMPDTAGLLLWAAGLTALWRSRLRHAMPMALIPITGLVVNRPYWGFLAMPLCIVALGGLPPARAPARSAEEPVAA